MIQKTIAVVGGGISSLSFVLNLAQRISFKENIVQVKVFQKNFKVGGRISAEQSPQDEAHHTFCADVGANYIDFDNQEEKKFLQANLPKNLILNFKPFEGKFLIYENSKLTEPQNKKTRYFYQGGFNHMAADWKQQIQGQKTLNFNVSHHQVQKVQKQKNKWRIRYAGEKKQMNEELFDIVIFGVPAPQSKIILEKSSLQNSKDLLEQLGNIKYTKQISAIFEVDQQQSETKNTPYSILFRNHQLTFICFHQQKYPSNQKNIAVIQMNEDFTQKYSKKLSPSGNEVQINHNQIQEQIAQEIWTFIPKQIIGQYKLTKKCLGVHYWPQSLIKPFSQVSSKEAYFEKFNSELNKNYVNEQGQKNLYFTGDYLNNKSRVTGAIAVGIKLSQQILKQHFEIGLKKTF